MQTKTILIAILAVLIVLSGAFYWYSWRPTEVRKECFDSAIKNPFKSENISETEFRNNLDFVYKNCLKMHGLEK